VSRGSGIGLDLLAGPGVKPLVEGGGTGTSVAGRMWPAQAAALQEGVGGPQDLHLHLSPDVGLERDLAGRARGRAGAVGTPGVVSVAILFRAEPMAAVERTHPCVLRAEGAGGNVSLNSP
jgi:hypothetical protein